MTPLRQPGPVGTQLTLAVSPSPGLLVAGLNCLTFQLCTSVVLVGSRELLYIVVTQGLDLADGFCV